MIRKLLPILGITFVDIIGFSMLLPILPYFVTHFGAKAWVVGVLFSVFAFCGLIAGPLWGNASDRIGRKAILIISQIGATVGWVMLAFSPNIFWVFVARIIEGASGGNIGVTQAYVADLVEPKDRSRAFGLIGAMFGGGMVFGPVIGGVLFAKFGYPAPFLVAAALQVITLIMTVLLLPESRTKEAEDGERSVGFRDILTTFHKPLLRPILLQKLALSLGLYGWFAVIALYLKAQMGLTLEQTTFFFSLFAAFNVFCNGYLVGRVSAAIGDRNMSTAGLGILVAGFVLVPFVHVYVTLFLVMTLFSLGMSLANTGITALISNEAGDREQGTVLSVSSSLDSFSGIVAPPISTGMLTRFGSPYSAFESLAFAVVAFGLGIAASRRGPTAKTALETEETVVAAVSGDIVEV